MATLVDVARLAHVSTSTVSHVLNRTRPVRDETRARVVDAIEQTGYTPHAVARALARGRTDSVGVVVSDIGNPFFGEVIRGVEAEARRLGLTLLMSHSAEDPVRERETIQALHGRRVDGLILALTGGTDRSMLDALIAGDVPVVLVDRLNVPGVDQVGVENLVPTSELVAHLVGLGHRRIAMVAGLEGISTSDERCEGYRMGLAASGIAYDPDLVVDGQSRADVAQAAVRELMSRSPRPTALVIGNNLMALGALRALQALRLDVPRDVAIVSYDDFEWADLFRPRLTTVAQPCFAIGQGAMRLLMRRIRHRDAAPRTVRLEPRIVHRESCGCPPGAPFTGVDGRLPPSTATGRST